MYRDTFLLIVSVHSETFVHLRVCPGNVARNGSKIQISYLIILQCFLRGKLIIFYEL